MTVSRSMSLRRGRCFECNLPRRGRHMLGLGGFQVKSANRHGDLKFLNAPNLPLAFKSDSDDCTTGPPLVLVGGYPRTRSPSRWPAGPALAVPLITTLLVLLINIIRHWLLY
jgi:hypothetical protein